MAELFLQHAWPRQSEDDIQAGLTITQFPCVAGRGPECDHHIDMPFISRRHCTFMWLEGRPWVQDLGSKNGTYLNGKALEAATPLSDGDKLNLGHLPFEVCLPKDPGAPAVQSDVPTPASSGSSVHNVLVVDDNPDAAESLAMLLRIWGHEVRVAHDGVAALEVARIQQPDTVLLDLKLPGLNGYQVAERLRAEPAAGDTQLIAITGYDAEDAGREFKKAGFNRLLTKPVDPRTLEEILH